MDTIYSQLLILLPFVGLGVFVMIAYAADGMLKRDDTSRDEQNALETVGESFSQMDEGEPMLRWLVLAVLAMADLGAIVFGGLAASVGFAMRIDPGMLDGGLAPLTPPMSGDVLPDAAQIDALSASLQSVILPLGLISMVLGFLGFLLLVPTVRVGLAKLIPIDPQRIVHTVALHYALLLVSFSAMIAFVISDIVNDPEASAFLTESIEQGGLLGIWMQNLGFVILGFLGVGMFVRRSPRAVLDRLGLTPWIHIRWWAGATLAALAASWGVDAVWGIVSPESLNEVSRLSEVLFEPIIRYGIPGALTIGLAAGIGEEIIFRGAAQPRLGLGLTALLFAAIHTQYSVSFALVQIFIVALLLGYARKHSNTTTTIAIHATYNLTLAMAAVLGA